MKILIINIVTNKNAEYNMSKKFKNSEKHAVSVSL